MFGNVVQEIDETLDRLIQNAEAISGVDLSELSETELDAFQKTQESLLHHLLEMDGHLVKKSASYQLHEKRMRFEKLKMHYVLEKKRPIVAKRRAKRLIARKLAKRCF